MEHQRVWPAPVPSQQPPPHHSLPHLTQDHHHHLTDPTMSSYLELNPSTMRAEPFRHHSYSSPSGPMFGDASHAVSLPDPRLLMAVHHNTPPIGSRPITPADGAIGISSQPNQEPGSSIMILPPPPQIDGQNVTIPTRRDGRHSPKPESFYAPNAAELYSRATIITPTPDPNQPTGAGANHYPFSNAVPRLPPIMQVEKQQVTTSATQVASASRRRNEANFVCPVPGCGSTFTRRFNLRGHLRSHTEERPYVCEWPGCKKGFARQHDCKRHQALHSSAKSQSNTCQGCQKNFSRLDALNRHLRSSGGESCRKKISARMAELGAQEGALSHGAPSMGPSSSDMQAQIDMAQALMT